MDFFYSIAGFILSIGILVIFHELGHFIIARLCGVKVLKFSIGFGPSKVLWKDSLGTQYLISAVPLGGYVQLLDTSDQPDPVNTAESNFAINNKSPWVRTWILLGGPLANLLLAIVLYWLVFLLGISTTLPFIGEPAKGSVAEIAKINSGSRITSIAGLEVASWEEVATNIIKQVINERVFIPIETYNPKTDLHSLHTLNLSNKFYGSSNSYKNQVSSDILKNIGLEPLRLVDNKISKVYPDYPAFKAGMKPEDVIISIDNIPVDDNFKITEYLKDKLGKQVVFTVDRKGEVLHFNLTPVVKALHDSRDKLIAKGGASLDPVIGVQFRSKPYPKEYTITHRFSFKESFYKAVHKTQENIVAAAYLLYFTVTGKLAFNNAAGPIAIGYYAGQSMKNGIEYFLNFLGIVSINLGILNLLPIPWLDGGSIVYCFYEILFKKPFPTKLINFTKIISLSLLILLAVLAIINDIAKL